MQSEGAVGEELRIETEGKLADSSIDVNQEAAGQRASFALCCVRLRDKKFLPGNDVLSHETSRFSSILWGESAFFGMFYVNKIRCLNVTEDGRMKFENLKIGKEKNEILRIVLHLLIMSYFKSV